MSVKMAAAIPADHNGLGAIYGALVQEPGRQHVILAVIDTSKLTTDTDLGVVSPTVRIRHIEVVGPDSIPAARAMMQRALEARTGQLELPFREPFDNVFDLRSRGVFAGRHDDSEDADR